MANRECLLLLSGGRDSTVSSNYIAEQYDHLTLITVQADYLTKIEDVYLRLEELKLKPALKNKCTWKLYKKIEDIQESTTCLSCHAYYIALAQNIAMSNNIQDIALGYSGYQNHWEEQSEYAKISLKKYFKEIGLNLLLPVEHIIEKDDILKELKKCKCCEDSKEQKCTRIAKRDANYRHLTGTELNKAVDSWIPEIRRLSKILKEKNYESTCIDTVIF